MQAILGFLRNREVAMALMLTTWFAAQGGCVRGGFGGL